MKSIELYKKAVISLPSVLKAKCEKGEEWKIQDKI